MVEYSLCPQTCSFPDILDFFLSCTHTHTHHKYLSTGLNISLSGASRAPEHAWVLSSPSPHPSFFPLLITKLGRQHDPQQWRVYILSTVPVRSSVPLHLYMFICELLYIFFYAHMYPACTQLHCSEFQLQLVPARPARVGDEVPAGVTGAGGYYACGANVATEACGRERGREGGGEVLTGE